MEAQHKAWIRMGLGASLMIGTKILSDEIKTGVLGFVLGILFWVIIFCFLEWKQWVRYGFK